MIAIERPQRGRVERLAPEAHASHAARLQGDHQVGRDVERIGLDRHFRAGDGRQPRAENRKQSRETRWAEVRGRAAAEVERVEIEWHRTSLQFPADRRQVSFDQVVAAGHEREVAVAAAVPAEGHVDVGESGTGGWVEHAGVELRRAGRTCRPAGMKSTRGCRLPTCTTACRRTQPVILLAVAQVSNL